MTGILKVDQWKDSGDNALMTSDGSGNLTANVSIAGFSSTGIDDNATSTAITIDSAGDVGIGTTSPTGQFDVRTSSTSGAYMDVDGNNFFMNFKSNSVDAAVQMYISEVSGGGKWAIGTKTTGGTLTERMTIGNDGNAFHKGGTYVLAWNSGTFTWSSGTDGNTLNFYEGGGTRKGYLTLGGTWTNTSDRALKENIVDIPYGLSEIMQLQPRKYNVIGYEPDQIGFIAQEVEGIIPELVDGVEGEKGLAYSNMTSLLTKGIQELKTENDSLKTKVETLETTVANLTARLEALENA